MFIIESSVAVISYSTESRYNDYQLSFNIQHVIGAVVQPAGCLAGDVILFILQVQHVTDKLRLQVSGVDY